jgi:hypothetical protein
MKHTWTTISDERNNAHSKIENILSSSKKTTSFLQEYKKAAGAAMFGLVLLFASLIVPKTSMYKAALEIPQVPGITLENDQSTENLYANATIDEAIDFEDEAQEIEIEPLDSTPNEEENETNETIDGFEEFESEETEENNDTSESDIYKPLPVIDIEQEEEDFISFPPATNAPTTEENDQDREEIQNTNEELNIFESIETQNTTNEEVEEYANNKDFPVAPINNYGNNENFYSAAPDASNIAASPFKENLHTYNKVSEPIISVGNIQDPFTQEEPKNSETEEIIDNSYETLHAAARIVKIQQKTKNAEKSYTSSGTQLFTGKLQPSKPKHNAKYQFAFILELEDQTRIRLNTNRDLRSVLGQTLSIEIEGTKDKFILKHVYYKPAATQAQLVQSGPQSLMIFTGLLALILSFFYSRRSYKSYK